MTTILYIMIAENYIKIGVTTRSVHSRVEQIQTGCPLPIEEASSDTLVTDSMSKEEHIQYMEAKFNKKRKKCK